MSEKKRQKKAGEDKNKNDRRMRAVQTDVDESVPGKQTGREGRVKKQHGIDSVSRGYNDYGDQT
jgi:hypothetical protein